MGNRNIPPAGVEQFKVSSSAPTIARGGSPLPELPLSEKPEPKKPALAKSGPEPLNANSVGSSNGGSARDQHPADSGSGDTYVNPKVVDGFRRVHCILSWK